MSEARTRRLISFCVYGDEPKYLDGAFANLELAARVYPGWTCRFYVARAVAPSIPAALRDRGAEVVVKNQRSLSDGMFWRFLPASEKRLDAVIVRDTDSRLNEREARAVQCWLESGRAFHIMRDHPHHRFRVLGGMWGVRGNVLPDMRLLFWKWAFMNPDLLSVVLGWKAGSGRGLDQHFLGQVVYPLVREQVLIHSDHVRFEGEDAVPFPGGRVGGHYVGQAIHGPSVPQDQMDESERAGKIVCRPHPDFGFATRLRRGDCGRCRM